MNKYLYPSENVEKNHQKRQVKKCKITVNVRFAIVYDVNLCLYGLFMIFLGSHVAFDIPAARKYVSFGLKLCGLQRPERHLCTKLHKMEANLLLAKIFFYGIGTWRTIRKKDETEVLICHTTQILRVHI